MKTQDQPAPEPIPAVIGRRLRFCIFGVCALAFFFRLWIISHGVTVSPDGKQYIRIAENLIGHACYSISDPTSASCEPTWSNQPPGYPFFVAAVISLFGSSPMPIVLMQAMFFCIALAYLLWSAARLGINPNYVISAGMVMALSPSAAGWSRWVLTETLSAAACLWVVAECLNSLTYRRLSILRFAIAIGLCALVRWDMIWVAIPLIVVALWVLNPWRAVTAITFIGSLSAVPYLAMVVRAALVGLPLVPSAFPPTDEVPGSVQSFWKEAAITQAATASLLWPVWDRTYSRISRTLRSDSFAEQPGGGNLHLVRRLALTPDGEPVPPTLEDSLAAAANKFADEGPFFRTRIILLRVYHMWADSDTLSTAGFRSDVPAEKILARAADALRVLIVVVGVCGLVRLKSNTARMLIAGILLMNLARTVFLASFTALEIRYLSACLPALEFASIAMWGWQLPPPARPVVRQ